MKRMVLLVLLLSSIVLFAEDQISISMALFPPYDSATPFNLIYPANFNPEEPESQPLIFNINIIPEGQGPAPGWYLEFHASWSGGSAAEIILTPEPATTIPLYLTNRDVLRDEEIPYFEEGDSDYDEFIDSMEDEILQTGHLPNGSYELTMQAFDSEGSSISGLSSLVFSIESASPIILITPGSPIGTTIYEIGDANPLFVWASNLKDTEIQIYELDDENISVDQLESMEPVQTIINGEYANTYAYQGSDYILIDNTVYAWRVLGQLINPAASSTDPTTSEYYLFKFVSDSSVDPTIQTINNIVNNITDPQVQLLVNLLNNGYTFNNVVINGQTIPPEELINILMQIQNGTLEIDELIIQ